MTALLEASALARTYATASGPRPVLEQVNLSVQPGERIAVYGPSGAGKSTLLQVLAGLDPGYTGSVTFEGHQWRGLDDRDASRLRGARIGFVFQRFHLLEAHSVLRNVLLPASFVPVHDAEARAVELLARLGLAARHHDAPRTLSGGERQRVALARALLCHPAILFADEPTANLDAETAAQVWRLVHEETERAAAALVVVSHDPTLRAGADQVWRLANGTLHVEVAP